MPLANPVTKKSLGQKAVIVLTTPPAAGTGIPTLAEANAGKVLSLHFYGDFAVTPARTPVRARASWARSSPRPSSAR
jgi:hypothetical protein